MSRFTLQRRVQFTQLTRRLHLPKPLVFILAFAILGTILLFTSRAATPYASLEPEQGTKSSAITTVSDPAASGNSAIQFGSGPTTAPAVDTKVLVDPKAKNTLALLGRGRIATAGNLELLLYWEEFTWPTRVVAHVTDTTTGTTSLIDLPSTAGDWTNPVPVLTSAGDLYILNGDAPVMFHHYKLSGSPLPTNASFISRRTFGDNDSHMGAMIQLKSGALAAVWHQHGTNDASQGHSIAFRRTDGSWQEQTISFTKTASSKDTLVQHPTDNSIWLFNNADALGTIAAARLTEVNNGLRVDWSKWDFISTQHGEFDADPAYPDVVALSDPWAGDIVLAYQSAKRLRVTATVLGSYPAIVRLKPDGQMTFTHLPVWVERVSWLSLSLRQGEVWLAYRLINETDLSTDNLELRVLKGSTWSEPAKLGKASFSLATPTGASFAYDGIDERDGKIYLTRVR